MNAPRSWPLWMVPLIALLCAVLGLEALVWAFYRKSACSEALGWLSASHARDALRLAQNLRWGMPLSFFLNLGSAVAPVPSLVRAPFALGAANDGATLVSLLSFVGVALVGGVSLLHPRGIGGNLAGALAFAALLLTSPFLLLASVSVTNDAQIGFWLLLAVAAWWRSLDVRAGVRLVSVAVLALLLSDWRLGVAVLVVGLARELIQSDPQWRRSLGRSAVAVFDPRVFKVVSAGAWLAVGLAVFVAIGGGRTYTVAGRAIALVRPEPPIWAALVLFAFKAWKLWSQSDVLRALCPPRHRTLLRWLLIPYLVWLAIPIAREPDPSRAVGEGVIGIVGNLGFALFLSLGVLLAIWRLARLPADRREGPWFALGSLVLSYALLRWYSLTPVLPLLFLVAAWGISGVRFRPAVSVGAGLLLAAVWLWTRGLEAHLSAAGGLDRLCLDGRIPAEWRREVLERGSGYRAWHLIGLEPGSPLGPVIEWELLRLYPDLSHFRRRLSGGGNAVEFVEAVLKRPGDWWVLCLKPRAGLTTEDDDDACRLLEARRPSERIAVSLPVSGYDGVLYGISPEKP